MDTRPQTAEGRRRAPSPRRASAPTRERRPSHERAPGGAPSATAHPQGQPDAPGAASGFWRGFLQALALSVPGVALVVYFVWLCVEMGSHVHSGLAELAGTFIAVAVALVAGAVGASLHRAGRRTSRDASRPAARR